MNFVWIEVTGQVESKQQTKTIAESTDENAEKSDIAAERSEQSVSNEGKLVGGVDDEFDDVSDIYTEESDSEDSNSDEYYEGIDSENDYEYIEVSEYEVTDSEETQSVCEQSGQGGIFDRDWGYGGGILIEKNIVSDK